MAEKKKPNLAKHSRSNPWTTLRTREIYDNPWIRVSESDVLTPAGTKGIYGVVRFKNVAIGVVALDDRGRILMVGQYRYPLKRYSWEIPEGGCPIGTSPLASARRELKEETGYRAKRWTKLLTLHLSNSSTDERALVFLAEGLREGDAEPEETESLAVRWVPLEEALREVRAGRITDAITVAAILHIALAKKPIRAKERASLQKPSDRGARNQNGGRPGRYESKRGR